MQYCIKDILDRNLSSNDTFYALRTAHLLESHPGMPSDEVVQISKGKKYPNTSNGITQKILDYIKYLGQVAFRVSSAGRKVKGKGGKEFYIPSTTRRGTPDVMATICGLSVSVEVKAASTGDAKRGLSDAQKEVKADIDRAQGIYIIATSFDQFFAEFHAILSSKGITL